MIKKDKVKDLHHTITGVLTNAEINAESDKILLKHGETAKVPGFRPGKIPLATLRQKFGNSALSEAVDNLINADMNAYIADKKLRLAGRPNADIPKFELHKDIEYTVEFEVLPTLPEIDLSKFTITKKVAEVPAGEVDKSLENLRRARSTFEKADDKYKAQNGDTVIIDFKGFVGKDAFEGGEAKKHHLHLGSGQFIPGFEDQIVGKKTGEKFDVNVKFPAEYHAPNLAGKDARFEVEIHEIRQQKLAEITDELAKEIGQESVAKLREHIATILGEQYADAAQAQMRTELLDVLADKVKLEVPASLVAQEVDMARQEQGDKFDEKAAKKDAERRVKLGLILAEWGAKNGVAVSNEDLQQAIWAEAARYPGQQSEVFEFYNKNPNALSMVRGMIYEKKSLDAMLTHVKTKDKTVKPEELFKQK